MGSWCSRYLIFAQPAFPLPNLPHLSLSPASGPSKQLSTGENTRERLEQLRVLRAEKGRLVRENASLQGKINAFEKKLENMRMKKVSAE